MLRNPAKIGHDYTPKLPYNHIIRTEVTFQQEGIYKFIVEVDAGRIHVAKPTI